MTDALRTMTTGRQLQKTDMRRFAEPILREVPDTVPEYGEAKRMLKFLDNFIPISPEEIPPTSLLREFIGGSSFKY
mgnify:CR=1 FL=1